MLYCIKPAAKPWFRRNLIGITLFSCAKPTRKINTNYKEGAHFVHAIYVKASLKIDTLIRFGLGVEKFFIQLPVNSPDLIQRGFKTIEIGE